MQRNFTSQRPIYLRAKDAEGLRGNRLPPVHVQQQLGHFEQLGYLKLATSW